MRILASMPGRSGDIIWSLPTVRALSQTFDTRVCLQISAKYGSLAALIRRQPYIDTVFVDDDWLVQETAPMTPRCPPWILQDDAAGHIYRYTETEPNAYDHVFHLGYSTWPRPDLARDIYDRADAIYHHIIGPGHLAPLDLSTPWILPPWDTLPPQDLAIGFTDEHFELKYGLYLLIFSRLFSLKQQIVNVSTSPRWQAEAEQPGYGWEGAAAWISQSTLFVGCCSALHVLAVALGKPVIVVEPNPHRHNAVFYPLGTTGQVQLLLGTDGQPTIDARHLQEAITAKLAAKEASVALG